MGDTLKMSGSIFAHVKGSLGSPNLCTLGHVFIEGPLIILRTPLLLFFLSFPYFALYTHFQGTQEADFHFDNKSASVSVPNKCKDEVFTHSRFELLFLSINVSIFIK